MNVKQKPLVEVTEEALEVLHRELGTADTIRFLRQFASGFGNYTDERAAQSGEETLDELLVAIRARRVEKEPSNDATTTKQISYQQRIDQIRQRYPRAYEKWTADEDALLTQKYQAGSGIQELARLLNRQQGAIESRLHKLGLTR